MPKIPVRSVRSFLASIAGSGSALTWTHRPLGTLVTAAIICSAAHADNPHETACQRVGTLAAALARARDSGLSQPAAIAAVQASATPAEQPLLTEAARLLYERFRQMAPDSAEFEFMLDCLDSAD